VALWPPRKSGAAWHRNARIWRLEAGHQDSPHRDYSTAVEQVAVAFARAGASP
jgi:hypothetical protein